jgi:hypothetical protein
MVSNLMDTDCHALSREFFKAMVCLSTKLTNQPSPFMAVCNGPEKKRQKTKKEFLQILLLCPVDY